MKSCSKILNHFTDKMTKKQKSFNVFANYRNYSKEENKQLPGNVTYKLVNREGEITMEHKKTSKIQPKSLTEEFDQKYSNMIELPRPALKGYFYSPISVLAKEISEMIPILKEQHKEPIKNLDVFAIYGCDGIGLETEFRSKDDYSLSSKAIISSLKIIRISEVSTVETVILWENQNPNSPFTPAILLAIGDENCPSSTSLIWQKLGPHFKMLENNKIVLQDDISVKVRCYFQFDGKMKSQVTGHAGSSSDYLCQSCFCTSETFHKKVGCRTIENTKKTVSFGKWNPDKKKSVYTEVKGSERKPFFDFEMCEMVPDSLHVLLNTQSYYENAIIKVLAYCHLNDQTPHEDLFKKSVKDTRLLEAETKFKQHVKREMQFSRSVAEKRQNPGKYCKTFFKPQILDKIFSILVECEPKLQLRKSIDIFCKMKSLMAVKSKTSEIASQFKNLASEWIDHKNTYLKWMSNTNTTHNLCVHMVDFMTNEDLPLSLLDFSTECYEHCNKMVKDSLLHRSFLGNIDARICTALKDRYLRGCFKFRFITKCDQLLAEKVSTDLNEEDIVGAQYQQSENDHDLEETEGCEEAEEVVINVVEDEETEDETIVEEHPSYSLKIPSDLKRKFIEITTPKTEENIETLAYILGTKKSGICHRHRSSKEFCIDIYEGSHLIFPHQTGNSVSCTFTDLPEKTEQFQKYLQDNSLIIIGWVHTHPRFDCFFSSLDLHSQFAYQKDDPCYFGMVYSGIKQSMKAFRLTPLGMNNIRECIRNPPMNIEENRQYEVNVATFISI